MKTTRILVLLSIVLSLTACGPKIDRSKLLGEWWNEISAGGSTTTNVMFLNADGTFRKEFRGSALRPQEGNWKLAGTTLHLGDHKNDVYTVALADGQTLVLEHLPSKYTATYRRR